MHRPSFDLVCFSHLRWDFVFQRPQHLLSRFARHRRVLFVEEPVAAHGGAAGTAPRLRVRTTAEGVLVAAPELPAGLESEARDAAVAALVQELLEEHEVEHWVAWYYTPMALPQTRELLPAPLATVFDCMDELSAFAGAPAGLADLEAELLARADVVFTGGRSLYEAKRGRHPDVHAFPSSVDVAHFASARDLAPELEPEDQAALPHPRIGFHGVIDERIDLDLIARVADARPEWQLVLIGPTAKIDPATLPQRANIAYLGMKGYDELPAYLSGWDVAMLPFALNEATRFISPTKTPEYLAGGRPVVSTPIRDVVEPYGREGLVEIASGPGEFVAAVEKLLADKEAAAGQAHAPGQARIDAFLARSSWETTQRAMQEHVERAIAKNGRRPRASRRRRFDVLVVGAGFAGATLAERLAADGGKRVLVVDRRNHVGGNAHDRYDAAGVLIHTYGPHIFHTNSAEVFDYLSRFTDWRPYEHRVRASVDGRLVPIPINLDTINELYGMNLDAEGMESFLESVAEPVDRCRTSEDVVVSKVGRELYEKFFRNYTRKQWGLDPSELDASVTARVPTRTNRDDRYFTDTFQAMPLHGYTRLFERMLDHPNISVLLNADFRDIEGVIPYDELVFTGPVDEFFGFRYGKLPYRSLEFRWATHDTERFQPAPVVNFPNEHQYTRCTEFKWLTGQVHPKTTVVYEIPRDEGDPYYPVPRPENAELYRRYKALADARPDVHFVGRLATYRYYNMDQVVAQALATYRRLSGALPPLVPAPVATTAAAATPTAETPVPLSAGSTTVAAATAKAAARAAATTRTQRAGSPPPRRNGTRA